MSLHGVETIELQKGARPISEVKTAVIGLVGTAPKAAAGIHLIRSRKDAKKTFGFRKGYTIPEALDAIFAQGSATVLAVNVGRGSQNTVVTMDSAKFTGTYADGIYKGYSYAVLQDAQKDYKDVWDLKCEVGDTSADLDLALESITINSNDSGAENGKIKWISAKPIPESLTITYVTMQGADEVTTTKTLSKPAALVYDVCSGTKIEEVLSLKATYLIKNQTDNTLLAGGKIKWNFTDVIPEKGFVEYKIGEEKKVFCFSKEKNVVGDVLTVCDGTAINEVISVVGFGSYKEDADYVVDEKLGTLTWVKGKVVPPSTMVYAEFKNDHFEFDIPVTKAGDSATYDLGRKDVWNVEAFGFKEGVDYTVDRVSGIVTWINEAEAPAKIKATFNYSDTNPADVVTGFNNFEKTYNKFGFFAKLLVSPYFCESDTVAAKMVALADKIRAVAFLDAPKSGTRTTSTIRNDFLQTSSERVLYCYPYVRTSKIYDADGKVIGYEEKPYSQYLAGVMSSKDKSRGYWWSPSNTEIKGVIGMEKPLTAMINNENSEVNGLNENGVVTIFNSFGTGFRVWGNRSASFPSSTAPTNFINVRRTADILHESVEYAMLQFIDMPINNALIDSIAESVNGFMRSLISRGALIDGKCWFDPAKNEPTEVAKGHITFDMEFMPPTPAEKITFESFINIEMLRSLGGK